MTRSQDGQPSTFATAIPGSKESASGTFRTSRGTRLESAMRTKAEVGQRLQKNGRGQEAELRETRH
jgi:hypothetical protein